MYTAGGPGGHVVEVLERLHDSGRAVHVKALVDIQVNRRTDEPVEGRLDRPVEVLVNRPFQRILTQNQGVPNLYITGFNGYPASFEVN